MMQPNREETTPLTGRRRRPLTSNDNDVNASLPTRARTNNRTATSKNDRRSPISRCWHNLASTNTSRRISNTASAFLTPLQMDTDTHYEDVCNDFSWECSCGTKETNGIWMNRKDQMGIIMSTCVWVLIMYSSITVALLARNYHVPAFVACVYCTISTLSLTSHIKTTLTDPGAVPHGAVPTSQNKGQATHLMCALCQTYKPPGSHHCRICGRCISGMDHHCPWMNNCIGSGNLKHFILFLLYTWIGSSFALLVFAHNYFFCHSEQCEFTIVLIQLVRVMTLLCIGAFLFTSSMLMSVAYAIMTGIGTIDRLKRKTTNTYKYSDDEPMDLVDIFGIGGYHTWPFPVDPIFADYDKVMGYSTTQRLLRKEKQEEHLSPRSGASHYFTNFDDSV